MFAGGGGVVEFPPGRYLTATIHLKSNVTLHLDAGAEIVGSPQPQEYQNYAPPEGTPLARRLWSSAWSPFPIPDKSSESQARALEFPGFS